jgi:tripartite-type tricarboxylate transporter receptor subunit TctC
MFKKIGISLAAIAAVVMAAVSGAGSARAAWPERPVTIIVPWGAGGAADQLARMLGSMLEQEFKQPFNVVNRTGGSGAVGHTAMAEAKPDGYTFGLGTVEITMMHWQGLAPITYKNFTPIAILNTDAGGLMVRTDSPYKSAKELIEDIKSKPAKTFKASGTGQGGIWHLGLIGWLVSEKVDANKVPWVPSQGSAPAMNDLLAGGVDFVTASLPEGRALIDAGRVRALANMDDKRLWLYPNAPTLTEATGSPWKIITWRGLFGPAGIPAEVMDKLVPAVKKAHASDQYKKFMQDQGFGWAYLGPKEATEHMAKADAEFGVLMKEAGLAK